MPRKLVILYTANYCNKMRNVFDVETLIKDYEIDFLNLSKITAHEELAPVYTDGLKEFNVENLFQFLKYVWENRKASPVYASVMNYGFFSYKVYLILSVFRCTFVTVTNGALPKSPMWNNVSKKRKIFRKINVGDYISKIFFKTPLIRPADYALVSSKKGGVPYKTNKNTQIFNSSSGDYLDAINIKRKSKDKIGNYIVFLDQNVPFHPDNNLLKIKTVDEVDYYSIMNNYFRELENKYQCEVIIAAHPSSIKYKDHNFFEGRKVVFNQTAELVLGCIGVLTHTTTAVSYAVAYKKPILLLSMPGFPEQDYIYMRVLSSELEIKVVDISKSVDVEFGNISISAYERYRVNYLSTVENGITNAQIFSLILNE